MLWNKHGALKGTHAFLGASKYAWLRYDDDKLRRVWTANRASAQGDDLHDLAEHMIRLGIRPSRTKKTFNMYVNDAITHGMHPELILFYSKHCYGSVDAISLAERVLRISDLKTGTTPAGWDQLKIYAALCCLEYMLNPFDLKIQLRIYQNDEVRLLEPDGDDIMRVMELIKYKSKLVDEMAWEEEYQL